MFWADLFFVVLIQTVQCNFGLGEKFVDFEPIWFGHSFGYIGEDRLKTLLMTQCQYLCIRTIKINNSSSDPSDGCFWYTGLTLNVSIRKLVA